MCTFRARRFWPHGDANTYGQLCYHNASLVKFMIAQAKLIMRYQPEVPWLSITQNDNENDCKDPEEEAIVAEEGGEGPVNGTYGNGHSGGRTGAQLRVVNAIADALREDFPDLKIDPFAYEQTSYPPRITKPASNVIIRIATETSNFAPRYSPVNFAHSGHYIESWANISSSLSIWDYTANYNFNGLIPVPDWFTVGPNRKWEAAHKVVGYMAEGSTYTAPGRDLSELWIYLNARLLWNASRDDSQLMRHFLDEYYGREASLHVYAYMQAMMSEMRSSGKWCQGVGGCSGEYYSPTAAFLSPAAVLGGAAALWSAKEATAHDPVRLARIERARLPVTFVLLLRWREMQAAHTTAHQGPAGPWPAEATQELAFQEFGRVANLTAWATRCHILEGGSRPGHFTNGVRCLEAFTSIYQPRSLVPADGSVPGCVPLTTTAQNSTLCAAV